MLNIEEHIGQLIVKYLQEELSEDESKYLQDWISQSPENKATFERNTTREKLQEVFVWTAQSQGSTWQRLKNEVITRKIVLIPFRKHFPYAAAVVALTIAAASYFWLVNKSTPAETATVTSSLHNTDILPANGRAILTLTTGQQIVLDSVSGIVVQQGNSQFTSNAGELVITPAAIPTEIAYNTVTIEKGRQYKIVLPDGTAVWMNAASSITFPNAFNGKERRVNITGEAYFEVAKDLPAGRQGAAKPFIVDIKTAAGEGRRSIEVLGTHFNISAYDGETMHATLLEGAVKVTKGNNYVVLKPGQQAQVNNDGVKVIKNPDTAQVMAWKNGIFRLKDARLESIMKEVEKYYNVTIDYKNKKPLTQELFNGSISRKEPLSKLLNLLEMTETVSFSIEGNRVIITDGKVK